MSRPFCQSQPETDFFLAPTTMRTTPIWFSGAQAQISRLVQEQVRDQQTRILPLPGYITEPSDLDTDGVHFLPVAGYHYCMHLIDSARYDYSFTRPTLIGLP
jgi:hypothetical protein